MTKLKVFNQGIAISLTIKGKGQPLILCPGLSFTQLDWEPLTSRLHREYQIFTFDLRGHGESFEAEDYSLDAFLGDTRKIISEIINNHTLQKPLLVGYSLGADLAVNFAASYPDDIAGLINIDGANPLPAPSLSGDFLPAFREMVESPALAKSLREAEGTPHQVLLKPHDILALNLELDDYRQKLLRAFDSITCPIAMLMSTAMAGTGTPYSHRLNQLWHDGVERLRYHHPSIYVKRFEGDHKIVFTKAQEIAVVIDNIA